MDLYSTQIYLYSMQVPLDEADDVYFGGWSLCCCQTVQLYTDRCFYFFARTIYITEAK